MRARRRSTRLERGHVGRADAATRTWWRTSVVQKAMNSALSTDFDLSLSILLKIFSKASCEPSSFRITSGSCRICLSAAFFRQASTKFFFDSVPVLSLSISLNASS